jgi:hypothetical protein
MLYQFEQVIGKEKQIKILYNLLENRIHNISHSEIPQYEVHKNFVLCHPYREWYLVKTNGCYVGSFYIKNDNSIGMNLHINDKDLISSCIKFIKKNFRPRKAIASMIPQYFFINAAPTNQELVKIMKALNIPPVQISFKI